MIKLFTVLVSLISFSPFFSKAETEVARKAREMKERHEAREKSTGEKPDYALTTREFQERRRARLASEPKQETELTRRVREIHERR